MADKEKERISGAAIGLLGLLAALALSKKPSPPPGEEQAQAGISIQIFDATTGQPVPQNSPALVVEGSSYLAKITVTNLTTQGGVPKEATLTITLMGEVGLVDGTFSGLIFTDNSLNPFARQWFAVFAPNEAKTWDAYFSVPQGAGGQQGSIALSVHGPNGEFLKQKVEPLSISALIVAVVAPLLYAADAVIQVF